MKIFNKKSTVIVGHYGCGKTNLSVNAALSLAGTGRISVIDMDIVNPYFRTADYSNRLHALGIKVISPRYAGTNLDIPVLDFDVESIVNESDHTIIDVGGSDSGAAAIGKYKDFFSEHKENFQMLYVFNMYRNCSAEETVKIMREIETACHIRCTGLVNNSNLGIETTPAVIKNSEEFASEVSRLAGLPIAFTSVTENEIADETHFPVKRLVTLPWEKEGEYL